MTEYRIDDLAREAGTTTRNIRGYQDRGLIPRPIRRGRIAVYIEAWPADDPLNLLYEQALAEARMVALACVIRGPLLGGRLLIWPDKESRGTLGDEIIDRLTVDRAQMMMELQRSQVVPFAVQEEPSALFIDVQPPPPKLLIVGAVHIAIPLITFANVLGFHTVVLDARSAFATPERFSHAHRLQIGHKVKGVAVEHRLGETVGDRQGEPRPLQQRAKLADFTHRQDTRRQAARHLGLSLGQTGAEFVQRLATEHQADEQPVGLQRAAALHQLPHRIIRPMQRKGVDHQIMGAFAQGKRLFIRHHRKIRPERGKTAHHHRRRKGSVNLGESLLNLVARLFLQEENGSAGAVAGQGGPVCQDRWRHGRGP